tara:strand:+ start:11396 stop:11875 length:480 start_codon:yes stop_codon:yes gene_type:complete
MTRKVVSVYDYGFIWPSLPVPMLGEDLVINEAQTIPSGNKDPRVIEENKPIFLCNQSEWIGVTSTHDGRCVCTSYYSVSNQFDIESVTEDNITNKKLTLEDYNFSICTGLTSEFSQQIFDTNREIATKYNEDENYLEYLGLPSLPVGVASTSSVGIAST